MQIHELTPEELLGPLNSVEEKNAPELLYVAGDLQILKTGARVSIVGSRKASPEGLARAGRLAAKLAAAGHVVVSGLAAGIDVAAHRGAMDAGGKTIAVIGTPLSKAYPKEHRQLQTEIAESHLLVSQFEEGFQTRPWCFPMRNRTMALLCDASVIVEAGETSGSLSQGWEALRLGRSLFIMNAVAKDPKLKWPAEVLKYGAEVLSDETFGDFLEMLPKRTADIDALAAF